MTSQEQDDLAREVLILQRMTDQLPESIRDLFQDQIIKVLNATRVTIGSLAYKITNQVDDAILDVKAMEFDLEATRRERDALRARLEDLS